MGKYIKKTIVNPEGESVEYIFREDGAQIPLALENRDYQDYLKHLTENPTEGENN